jgi:hypothetical protein
MFVALKRLFALILLPHPLPGQNIFVLVLAYIITYAIMAKILWSCYNMMAKVIIKVFDLNPAAVYGVSLGFILFMVVGIILA